MQGYKDQNLTELLRTAKATFMGKIALTEPELDFLYIKNDFRGICRKNPHVLPERI